ncbi:MAG: 6-phosphogluconolactonase [Planctomycetia bacterium]|nr:6-phosphogluconolactonase [Planctomycetia bacterium]
MIKTFTQDQLYVEVCSDRAELGRRAGAAAAEAIAEAIARQGQARVIFAAAPSQNETLDALMTSDLVDWTKVVAIHMDEYVGLPLDSNARFARYLDEHCFSRAAFKEVHYIDPCKDEPIDVLLNRYRALLAQAPIDVVCMGIGENGHVAFNDPPVADFKDPEAIKLVQLDDACRTQQVNDGCFPSFDATPTHALTLTVPTLANARRQICAVPGKLKANAVKNTLFAPVSTQCPATILRTLPGAALYLDADSYSLCEE